MITFNKIRWKNFLSTGNNWTEIDFQKNHTNLIIGTNGAGKSTVLDALTFVLFNKPFRKINKPQLVNTVNEKDCLVEIEFSVNSRDYLVRRGIKPNIFDIEVNGKLLHKESDDRANQRILEESNEDNDNITLESISHEVHMVSENIPVPTLIDQFVKRKTHLFIVYDNYGQTVGVVTLEDAIETLLGVEIVDEMDEIEDMQVFAKDRSKKFQDRMRVERKKLEKAKLV